jgi:hypothetical protein
MSGVFDHRVNGTQPLPINSKNKKAMFVNSEGLFTRAISERNFAVS